MSVNIYDKETKTCKEVANKTRTAAIDDVMSDTSDNPVKNKVSKKYVDDVKALRASTDSYGMVKVTNASDVTDSTGIALAGTEKNASIDGTLANQVSVLNSNLKQLSNPNLLINPDFRINQRGQTSWSGKDQYTVDRWRQFIDINGTITKADDGMIFDNTNGKISLGHFFDKPSYFAGKTVTLSAKIMQLSDNVNGSIYIGGNSSVQVFKGFGTSLIKDEWRTMSLTFTMPSELTDMNVTIFLNDVVQTKIKVAWMKLEFGSVATPFVPPDPASELLKCKRYFELLRFLQYETIGVASSISTWLNLMIPIVEKRIKNPSASVSMSINDGMNRQISVQPTNAVCNGSSINIGYARENEVIGTNYCWAEADGYILIDAEIH